MRDHAGPPASSHGRGRLASIRNSDFLWIITLDDPDSTIPVYVSVVAPPTIQPKLTIVQSCQNDGYLITDFQLGDTTIYTFGCDDRNNTDKDSGDLVTLLSNMPPPPIEIGREVSALLLAMGVIADGE